MTEPGARYDVLVFGAHPDDCEMGMAGTIALLVAAGKRVLLVALTGSDMSTHGRPEERAREFREAARVLGCDARQLDLPDTRVANHDENRRHVAGLVREHRPAIVFAPYHTNEAGHHDGRANVDHMETGRLVRDALKLARLGRVMPETAPHDVTRIYYYMVPAAMAPSFIVDVSSVEEKLRAAIGAYASQMAIRRGGSSILEVLELLRRHTGLQIGARLGEAFLVDQPLQARVEDLFP